MTIPSSIDRQCVYLSEKKNSDLIDKKQHIDNFFVCQGLSPQEQIECCRGTRGAHKPLCIDKHIHKHAKMRQKNEAKITKKPIIWSYKCA